MRLWKIPVRLTQTRRCSEGFYLLINGSRMHFKTRALAVEAIDSILSFQKIQVVSVREYADRRKHRQKLKLPHCKICEADRSNLDPFLV